MRSLSPAPLSLSLSLSLSLADINNAADQSSHWRAGHRSGRAGSFDLTLPERNSSVDIAKVILIYLVIFGHVVTLSGNIGIFIYAFHMPAFFIITGLLISNKEDAIGLIHKLSKKLIKPYFYFVVLGLLFVSIRVCFVPKEIFDTTFFWQLFYDMTPDKIFMGPGWFLWALFWGRIIFFFIEKYCHRSVKIIMYTILYIFSFNLFSVWNFIIGADFPPLRIDSGMLAAIFIKIGNMLNLIWKKEKTVVLAMTILLAMIFVSSSLSNGLSAVRPRMFNTSILFMLSAISGTLLILIISSFLSKITICNNIITYIAKNTLSMFMFNGIFVACLYYRGIACMENVDFLPAVYYTSLGFVILIACIPVYKSFELFFDNKLLLLSEYVCRRVKSLW